MLNWGLLSTARINQRLLDAVSVSGRSRVVAVASRDTVRATAYAREHGIPSAHGSYADLLADPQVDVVYNPLPNQLHAPWSVRALKAGKHVLCEKPMALSPVQVDVMARAARSAGRVLAEAFMYRHHPRTRRVRELVRDGAIGALRSVHGAFSFTLDRGDANYRLDPAQGGGALWDVGCYPVSFARFVIGEEPERVEGLAVDGPTDVDLAFSGVMRFPSGVLASFEAGFNAVFRSEITFAGTEGVLHVPKAFQPGLSAPIVLTRGEEQTTENVPGFDPLFLGEVQDMERAVLDGEPQALPLGESRGNAATLHALLDSARSGHAERP